MKFNVIHSIARAPVRRAGWFANENLLPDVSASGIRKCAASYQRTLAQLKDRVITELASQFAGRLDREAVRQAVNEADALAATTPFPALFLPTLAEEKTHGAFHWHVRQRQILGRPPVTAA
jgi:hypothetical protein